MDITQANNENIGRYYDAKTKNDAAELALRSRKIGGTLTLLDHVTGAPNTFTYNEYGGAKKWQGLTSPTGGRGGEKDGETKYTTDNDYLELAILADAPDEAFSLTKDGLGVDRDYAKTAALKKKKDSLGKRKN
jgi:hypothetical protein